MKCYKHHEIDALGMCKNCNKGLCNECVVDVGSGIACRNSCEQAVKDVNEIISRGKGMCNSTSGSLYRTAVMSGLLGLFFIFYPLFFKPFLTSFFLPVGVIFLLSMTLIIYSGRKFKK
jgi:hypothetical protein